MNPFHLKPQQIRNLFTEAEIDESKRVSAHEKISDHLFACRRRLSDAMVILEREGVSESARLVRESIADLLGEAA